jgi:hypothetical protein
VNALHQREIDHQTTLDDGLARDVVAAAADGDLDPFLAGEFDCRHDVGRVHAAHDQ